MRRALAILVLCGAAAALLIAGTASGGDDGTYEVRAVFDNAGFLVTGEEVRVAGANVGVVKEVGVSLNDEPVLADGSPDPGKAVVVMEIEDPAFQDFREDASCLIRPQSLIGEKFVECEVTQPRAAGTEAPPPLPAIPEGEAGEGQHLLPLESNGKAVDLDLVNNIMEEPYPDRFRLILNDLGAGLAARGDDLAEIVERSNPALRETNRVLAILAKQNRALAGLATDSDAILGALARERESVASFINEATVVGEATAERSAELEESFARFPGFLRELRATMVELRGFSEEATPLFSDLQGVAPSLARVNRLLEPFSNAGTRAFVSLGKAAEGSGPPLAESDPVIRQIRDVAKDGQPAMRNLSQLLSTMRKTDGFENLLKTLSGLSGSVNAFDQYGHFLRALIPLNVCFDYTAVPQPGCSARFADEFTTTSAARTMIRQISKGLFEDPERKQKKRAGDQDSRPDEREDAGQESDEQVPAEPSEEAPDPGQTAPEPEPDAVEPEIAPAEPAEAVTPQARMRAMRSLLDFIVGSRDGGKR